MSRLQVAYLGPEGTFSHLVAMKRHRGGRLLPMPSIGEVFEFAAGGRDRAGIVPIENSSGGMIYNTVDGLIDAAGRLFIQEELSLDVRLALLGRKGRRIDAIYSHFAPLEHCAPWLQKRYPRAARLEVASTAEAARRASAETSAAAIGTRHAAKLYGLEVLQFPVESKVVNQTQFFEIGRGQRPLARASKSSYIVQLKDEPGSLCSLLLPFKEAGVNLTRITSRPVRGAPNRYWFYLDVSGAASAPGVRRAIDAAGAAAEKIIRVGNYPVRARYAS